VKRSLPELLREHFEGASFDPHDPDLTAGAFPEWDSFAHFNFFLLLEEAYNVRFSVEEMSELKSVRTIADALKRKGVELPPQAGSADVA
jgi:acyl carrier protein